MSVRKPEHDCQCPQFLPSVRQWCRSLDLSGVDEFGLDLRIWLQRLAPFALEIEFGEVGTRTLSAGFGAVGGVSPATGPALPSRRRGRPGVLPVFPVCR